MSSLGFLSWRGIILALFLLVGVNAKLEGHLNSAQEKHHDITYTKEVQQQGPRRLQQYTTPFTITWRIAIGNGGTDRQPTQQEYEWVVEASNEWFVMNIEQNYGSVAGLSLTDVQGTLVPAQTTWVPDARDFPHSIFIDMAAIWEATSAALVPETLNFLVTLNENSSVRDFIVDYLLVTGTDSIFHFSQRVSYLTATINTAPGPGPVVPAQTPVPAAPTAPTAPQPTPSFSEGWIIPVKLTFNVGVGLGVTDRQPTQQEYEGFQAAVEQWLLDSLRAAYVRETTFYVDEVTSNIFSTTWDPAANAQAPHEVDLDGFVVYTADMLSSVPSLPEFFATLRSPAVSLGDLFDTYLRNAQPGTNIFRFTSSGGYTSNQNGPRFSSALTTNPAAPPSTPAPASPPVSATPAPVMPDRIISSVTVESNWTYTVSGEFGIPDRQPTQAEYVGLVDSTHEWLNRILNEYYNANNQDQNLPMFVGVEAALLRGVYVPTAERPHTVIMDLEFTFALDPIDETEVMPFIDDIFDAVEQADLNQYVILYVHTSEPLDSSVFHGVDSVIWLYDVDEYTYVPRPTRPPTPGATVDLGGYTNIDRTQLESATWVSVSLLMEYRLTDAAAATSGEPTPAEWSGLAEATRQFWIDKFAEEYQNNPSMNFVIVDAKWAHDSTSYDAVADVYPYGGRYVTDIIFTQGSTVLSTVEMRQAMVGILSGSNYIPDYVQTLSSPIDNLFRQTLQVAWDF